MNYTIQLTPTTTMTTMQGQSVLFSKHTGDFFGLNPTAKYFVEKLLASDVETAAAEAATQFGVPAETLRADIDELVNELAGSKLVERRPLPGK